jgi:hypothetical protein
MSAGPGLCKEKRRFSPRGSLQVTEGAWEGRENAAEEILHLGQFGGMDRILGAVGGLSGVSAQVAEWVGVVVGGEVGGFDFRVRRTRKLPPAGPPMWVTLVSSQVSPAVMMKMTLERGFN